MSTLFKSVFTQSEQCYKRFTFTLCISSLLTQLQQYPLCYNSVSSFTMGVRSVTRGLHLLAAFHLYSLSYNSVPCVTILPPWYNSLQSVNEGVYSVTIVSTLLQKVYICSLHSIRTHSVTTGFAVLQYCLLCYNSLHSVTKRVLLLQGIFTCYNSAHSYNSVNSATNGFDLQSAFTQLQQCPLYYNSVHSVTKGLHFL